MGEKFSKKPLGVALGTVVAASFSVAPVANADQNPFELTDLSSGYTELAEEDKAAGEETCGESVCGEGKCGGKKASPDKKPDKKPDKMKDKTPEMSCGEGACGGSK
jgi:uncharacterized low-complexity protein